jgi:hypothetical protein
MQDEIANALSEAQELGNVSLGTGKPFIILDFVLTVDQYLIFIRVKG